MASQREKDDKADDLAKVLEVTKLEPRDAKSEEKLGSQEDKNGNLAKVVEATKLEPKAAKSKEKPASKKMDKKEDLAKTMGIQKPPRKGAKVPEKPLYRKYEFWATQPVPKMDEVITTNEPIELDADIEGEVVRKDPFTLPAGFVWDTLDLENSAVLKELYTLLSGNYVEDEDGLFRFDYPPEFLKWALKPPGWKQQWHFGVRVEKNRKLIGFISAIPAKISVHDNTLKMVEINFLCVHKKLRNKRVAPVLIREMTRRVRIENDGVFQAVYTAATILPKPIARCKMYHRNLNPKKLFESKFSHLTKTLTLDRALKLFKLPPQPKCNFLRPLEKADIPAAHALLKNYLSKFKLRPDFDEADFEHWFMPRKDIIESYVVDRDGKITDFISYFVLPATVLNHAVHKSIKAAYSFYNVATSMSLSDLMYDALILAKMADFDVFNALDVMDNKDFLEATKFGVGDGNLQYYLYNWRCPSATPQEIGLVLP